jgi:hypothetical protein
MRTVGGYNIGDTVQFTSLKPTGIIVSGRIKHYILLLLASMLSEKEVEVLYKKQWREPMYVSQ